MVTLAIVAGNSCCEMLGILGEKERVEVIEWYCDSNAAEA